MDARRRFLAGLGGIAASFALVPAPARAAPGAGVRYAMAIDLAKCIGCQACTVACAIENRVPAGEWRTVVSVSEVKAPRGAALAMLPRLCNHCDDPACVPPCPTKATYKTADGTVQIDADRCIGCGRCVKACPYGARYVDEKTEVADKCSFCLHRVAAGLQPACVETCVGGARRFGDLNDPASPVSRAIAGGRAHTIAPRKGTKPHVFYLGLDEALAEAGRAVLADPRA